MNTQGLKYIDPQRQIPGVPARDLSAAEVEQYGGRKYLISTGLYADPPRIEKIHGATWQPIDETKEGEKWAA